METQRSDPSTHTATQIVHFWKDLYLGGVTCDLRELSDKSRLVHQARGEEKAPISHFVEGTRGGVGLRAMNRLLGRTGKPPGSGPRIVKQKLALINQ